MSTTKLNTSPAKATAAAESSINLDEMGQFTGYQSTTESSETTLFEGSGSGFVYASMFSSVSLASQAECAVYNGTTSDGLIARGVLSSDGAGANHGDSKVICASPCFYNNGFTITGKSDGVAELNVCANILSVKTSGSDQIMATRSTHIDVDNPDSNYYSTGSMSLFHYLTVRKFPLVYFPLSSLPPGTVLSSAKMNLFLTTTNRDHDAEIHAVLKDWANEEVTWNSRLTATAWSTPGLDSGTDYRASADWTGTVGPVNPGAFVEFDITDLVNEWLSGSLVNHGLYLFSATSQGSGSSISFTSQTNINEEQRPYMAYTIA